ncbi:hypothetical protein J3Q64DRAFT_1734329 [Phycomyces blakesleeanus]|uniref:Uncharacterized protein n=1 Tax=Phycomyces blakesleeanus TaxID=4837 RepID=A0ABR3B1Y5_PHYBL
MFLQRLQFILCIIVSIFVSKCRAPPIQQEYTISAKPESQISPTLHRRIIAFIYPTDTKKRNKKEKEQKAKEANGIMAENTNSPHTPLLPKISTPEGEKNQVDSTRLTESQTLCLKVSKLRERLFRGYSKIERIKIDEWDNSPHLAAFFACNWDRKNSRKTRHCILSGSVTIGCKTKEISVLGPGAICESQGKIHTNFLAIHLETAYNTDNTSYIFFTTLECLNLDGDRWIKSYNKANSSFSIKDEEDKQLVDTYEKRLLTEEDREILRKIIIDLDQNVNLTLLLPSLGHWDNLVLTMAVPIISMLSFGCLIAATITGYMPE